MNQLVTIDKIVDEKAGQFVSTLQQYKWDLIPDTQLIAAKQALTRSDYIEKIACGNVEAVHDSLIKAAILGLDLTEGKRQGWLLPRKNQFGKTVIQLQVGYKGVEAIHQRMGVINRLVVSVVHENDQFSWSGDDQEKPSHNADWFATEEQRGPIKGAYIITYYPDNSINVKVASIQELYEKHRAYSDSYRSYIAKKDKGEDAFPPPWVTHEKSMIEKTMAYIASKQWPANIRDSEYSSKILETLHEVDAADYATHYKPEHKEAFIGFIEAQDGLGVYLLSRRMGIEGYSAMIGDMRKAIPKGQGRMAYKDKVDDLYNIGSSLMVEINNSLIDGDSGRLSECLEDCSELTLKLVKSEMNDQQKATINEVINALQSPAPKKADV